MLIERTRHRKFLELCAWMVLFSGCHRAVHSDQEHRETLLGVNHVLHGKIYDVRHKRFTTSLELFSKLKHTPYLLLGEKHDNVDHHRLHARVIASLPKTEAIVLEMLSLDKADRVHKTQEEADFQVASDWDKSGWPDYVMYRPKIKAIYAHQLRPGAAHPTRTSVFKAMKDPNVGLGSPLTQTEMQTLSLAIDRAHCGHLKSKMVKIMMRAQMYKDKTMAHELIKQTAGGRGILIAGNTHLRSDYGVPKYLNNSTSLVFIEVQDERVKATAYDIEQYDYVWFTKRADDEDPCKKFESQLRRIRSSPHHK